jgi:hypothetical protein
MFEGGGQPAKFDTVLKQVKFLQALGLSRDDAALVAGSSSIFAFLRALGLNPMEWGLARFAKEHPSKGDEVIWQCCWRSAAPRPRSAPWRYQHRADRHGHSRGVS